jgi:hypothetical protein
MITVSEALRSLVLGMRNALLEFPMPKRAVARSHSVNHSREQYQDDP